MDRDFILCGVGGQGTILASKLLADAGLNANQSVIASETIGMSQRGGSVVSHVRIGQKALSPMIPLKNADVIIAFEPSEAVRNLGYLKDDGVLVVATKAIKPITATLGGGNYDGSEMIEYLKNNVSKLIVIDGEKICEQLGSSKVLNVVLLGASSASGMLGFTQDELKNAIEKRVAKKFIQLNYEALACGAKEVNL